MSGGRALAIAAIALGLASCARAKPPVNWIPGGERLDLVHARWTYRNDPVELRPRGPSYADVLVDGKPRLVIDRVGRVYDKLQRPIGLLEPDGRFVGNDQELLGTVGAAYAAMPGKANAWLSITPQGEIVKFEPDGTSRSAGHWAGCGVTPYSQQACLLVAYLLFFDDEGVRQKDLRVPQAPVGVGVGVGVTP